MVASRQVELPYYRAVERQRGRGFGALAQVIVRTTISFLLKYVVPAAKRIGADMLDFAAPRIGEVFSSRKFKTAVKNVGKKLWKYSWLAVANRGESFQKNLLNDAIGREETFLQTFPVDHVKQQFSVPSFCGSVWRNLGGRVPIVDKVLSSHEQKIYPTTSLDENCIEFEFQRDRNYYVDLRRSFLALKLKFVKGPGYDTYKSKEKKKEHKDESVVFTQTGDDQEKQEELLM